MTARHQWNRDRQRSIAATEAPDGNSRYERDCMPARGEAGHEWRTNDGIAWEGAGRPLCVEVVKPASTGGGSWLSTGKPHP
jgi:hypothetical protein